MEIFISLVVEVPQRVHYFITRVGMKDMFAVPLRNLLVYVFLDSILAMACDACSLKEKIMPWCIVLLLLSGLLLLLEHAIVDCFQHFFL